MTNISAEVEEQRARSFITGVLGFRVSGLLGAGCRCTVWRGQRGSETVAVKLFTREATAKHTTRNDEPLAHFEFNRNRRLYSASGLRGNIVRPVDAVVHGGAQALVQDVVEGIKLADFSAGASDRDRQRVWMQLRRIVAAAHDVSVFDLDLHSRNILVTHRKSGRPNVMLFDFNKIPFHEHPPNAVADCLVRLGWIGPASRDMRLLRAVGRRLERPYARIAPECRG